jgi:hypothetical protein
MVCRLADGADLSAGVVQAWPEQTAFHLPPPRQR